MIKMRKKGTAQEYHKFIEPFLNVLGKIFGHFPGMKMTLV